MGQLIYHCGMNYKKSAPVVLAIKKYWKAKTDKEIADGLGMTVQAVTKCRQRLGLTRSRW